MDVLAHDLLNGKTCRSNTAVKGLVREGEHWQLITADGPIEHRYDEVIVAMPPVQAIRLLGEKLPGLSDMADQVPLRPCWTAMIAFESVVELPFEAATVNGHSTIAWLARNSSKPGRPPSPPECWIVNARGDWAQARLDSDSDEIAGELHQSFLRLSQELGVTLPPVATMKGHRWTFALCDRAWGKRCVREATLGLTLCGDWLLGGRIEHAYLSGRAAAAAVFAA